jgi:MoxR-like ATPase
MNTTATKTGNDQATPTRNVRVANKGASMKQDAEILTQARKVGAHNYDALARALRLSNSNTRYRIRMLKDKGRIDVDGNVIDGAPATPPLNPATVTQTAINRDDASAGAIVNVIECDVDADALTPDVNPAYKTRPNIDGYVETLQARNVPTILTGDAGSGKTTCAEQFSARARLPFLRVACDDNATLKEFIGKREIINGTTLFKMGLLTAILQRPAVVLFDEFNALPASKLFFLHELLDNRRFFIKDADGGRVVNVHADCKIFLACNPNGAKYSGTNKSNCALIDRCAVVHVDALTPAEMKSAFDCGRAEYTSALMQFYTDTQRLIKEQGARVVISLRAVKRIATALRNGDDLKTALAVNFYNCALLTASARERDALHELARVHFGITDGDAESNGGAV